LSLARTDKHIDSIDENWIKGTNYRYDDKGDLEAAIQWTQITEPTHKKAFWMLLPPDELMALDGMIVTKENADYLQKIFEENWVDGYYFFHACVSSIKEYANEVAKIIINELCAVANERNIHVKNLYRPKLISQVCIEIFLLQTIDKKHFRSLIEKLSKIDMTKHEEYEAIISDPEFAKADNSFIDALVEKVVTENIAKDDGSDKIIHWFVGQVMKESKGKANAPEVREKLLKRMRK
jgi:Asp-tRNA(Asn)/Glu-tRNA(Gln) amidotransferase B subunit